MRTFRAACCLLLTAVATRAAVLNGIVVEHVTGRPLAHALVTATSVDGPGAGTAGVRAGASGQFLFPPLPGGAYLVSASRPGFATLRFGQKAWNTPGTPIVLDEAGSLFLELRLHRLGAVAGAVWDENEVGIPDMEVVAYRATRPPVQVGRARTDDRGIYRIFGLAPGQYLVRTRAKDWDEEGGLLPTFHRDVATVEEARPAEARLDDTTPDVTIRPFRGKLCRIAGILSPWNSGMTAAVTLFSDMGPLAGGGEGGRFSFDHIAPGTYDLVADGAWDRERMGAWRRIAIERDQEGISLDMRPNPSVRVFVEGKDGYIQRDAVAILARRKTLAGVGSVQTIRGINRVELAPGPWELTATAQPQVYVISMSSYRLPELQNARADAWNEVNLGGFQVDVRVVVSTRPASLRGTVTQSLSRPAVGVPVYLEAVDAESGKKRVAELRSALTDSRGQYRFAGLPPGTWRALATLEFEDPDGDAMEAARARTVTLKEAAETVADLELYTRP